MMQLAEGNALLPTNELPIKIGIMIPGQAEPPKEPVKLILKSSDLIAAGNHLDAVSAISMGGRYEPSGPTTDSDFHEDRLILPTPPEERKVVMTEGDIIEETSTMTWPHFVERRKFSCKPRVTDRLSFDDFIFATQIMDDEPVTTEAASLILRTEQAEDILQATLEFVGEVGEVAELIGSHGIAVLWGQNRVKLIDECGDILFTGAWALEAWAANPFPAGITEDVPEIDTLLDVRPIANTLLAATDTELYRFEPEDVHAKIAVAIMHSSTMKLQRQPQLVNLITKQLVTDLMQMVTFANLTANAAKKHCYQYREQDAKLQVDRILGVFFAVNFILCMANSSIEEAMITNRAKIDKRYSEGWKPGVGGGIRTEG